MSENTACQVCGDVGDPARYHPHIYCMLIRSGIRDPERYLVAAMPSLRTSFPKNGKPRKWASIEGDNDART